jgi:O-antigen/teichoic acid export membrane protein
MPGARRGPPAAAVGGNPGRRPDARRDDAGNPLHRLLAVASSVVGAHLATSVLGLVFWTMATRMFRSDAVGVGAAAVAAMTTAGIIGMLGFGTLLLSELPQLEPLRRAQLARAALATVALLSLLLGVGWAVAARELGSALRPIAASPQLAALFAAGVVLTAVTAVFDEAVLSSGRSSLQLTRTLVASVTKLIALPLAAAAGWTSGMTLYGTWTFGVLCSLPLVFPLVRVPRPLRSRRPKVWGPGVVLLRGRAREAAQHHVINLGLQVPMMLLPVLAAVVTSAAETAYFATARLAATFLFMFPFALALALFATATNAPSDAAAKMRRTLPGGLAISGMLALATLFLGEPMLSVFGREYAAHAARPLQIMAVGGLGLVVKDHYIALRRIEGRISQATPVVLTGVALEIALALVGGSLGGVRGLCLGWTAAVAVEALLAAPTLIMTLRRRRQDLAAAEAALAEFPSLDPAEFPPAPSHWRQGAQTGSPSLLADTIETLNQRPRLY